MLRFGANYTSPTYYELEDEYTEGLETYFVDSTGASQRAAIYPNIVNLNGPYKIKTAGKIQGSAALVLGKKGILSVDYGKKKYGSSTVTLPYADDTNARSQFALQFQLSNISIKVPNLIEQVGKWMTSYFLKINQTKTEIILFCPPSMQSVPTIQGIFINDGCIRFSTSVTLLGVLLDSLLTFDSHVSKLVSECWYHLKNISKIRRYLTTEEAKKVGKGIQWALNDGNSEQMKDG